MYDEKYPPKYSSREGMAPKDPMERYHVEMVGFTTEVVTMR